MKVRRTAAGVRGPPSGSVGARGGKALRATAETGSSLLARQCFLSEKATSQHGTFFFLLSIALFILYLQGHLKQPVF